MAITVVLADDHPLILDGLGELFRREAEFKVLARCQTGSDTLSAVRAHQPDVLILDLRMPGKNGLEVLREMKREKLRTRVVLLTAALDEEEVLEAMRLGVAGVVLKEMAPQRLLQCVRKVHGGGQWLETHSVGRALEKMLRREAAARQLGATLTPREVELVRLVAEGLRNKEIATRLSITEGTVKIHLHNIYQKLSVTSRVELARYARDKGLI